MIVYNWTTLLTPDFKSQRCEFHLKSYSLTMTTEGETAVKQTTTQPVKQ